MNFQELPYTDSQVFLAEYLSIGEEDGISSKIYTFKIIKNAANRFLRIFNRLNLKKNKGFAILEAESQGFATPSICTLLLSIWKHESHFCAVDVKASPVEIARQLKNYGTMYLFTDNPSLVAAVPQKTLLAKGTILTKTDYHLYQLFLNQEIDEEILPKLPKSDFLYAVTTSGSTGQPKTVYVPYDAIGKNVNGMISRLKVSDTDVVLLNTPMTFDPFFVEFLIGALQGCVLVTVGKDLHTHPLLYKYIFLKDSEFDGPNVTILQTTPARFRALTTEVIRGVILSTNSTLRVLLLGGECFPTLPELRNWVEPQTSKLIFNIYGITELSCWTTWYQVSHEDLIGNGQDAPPIAGETIDDCTKLSLVNTDGKELIGEAEGELLLGSRIRMCYIPQTDKDRIGDDILYRSTGDMVRRNADNQYFYVGRLDNTIKRHGVKVNLDLIEQHISASIKIGSNIACVWQPAVNKLTCFLQEHTYRSTIFSEIMKLPAVERPDQFIEIPNFPLNSNGKIIRSALLKIAKQSKKSTLPLQEFKKFLIEALNINLSGSSKSLVDTTAFGRLPLHAVIKLSFTQVGGTSFQAHTISGYMNTELLVHASDQQKFLHMLLDIDCSLENIFQFLQKAEIFKAKNSTHIQVASGQRKLHFKWRVNMHKCVDSSPVYVAASECIIVGGHSHELCTIDASTGEIRNKAKASDRIECKAEVSSEKSVAFMGSYDGAIHAYDYAAGRLRWSDQTGGMIKSKPLLFKNSVVIANYGSEANLKGYIYTDDKNGQFLACKWKQRICKKGYYASPILLKNGRMLICSLSGNYACLKVLTGDVIWLYHGKIPFFASPHLMPGGNEAVIIEVTGKVHIINLNMGEKLISYQAEGQVYSSPVVHTTADGTILIIFGCHDSHTYCLKYVSGKNRNLSLLWRTKLDSAVFATPVVCEQKSSTLVGACTTKGCLAIMNIVDGQLEASTTLSGEIYSSPVWLNGLDSIVFGCRDNYVYCYSLTNEHNKQELEQ